MVWYGMVWNGMVRNGMEWYGTEWHGMYVSIYVILYLYTVYVHIIFHGPQSSFQDMDPGEFPRNPAALLRHQVLEAS